MNYKSFDDLSKSLRKNLQSIPRDIDGIIGIPRSGMPLAYMIGLHLNKPVQSVQEFVLDLSPENGRTRNTSIKALGLNQKIILVDDSINSGKTLELTLNRIKNKKDITIFTLAGYATKKSKSRVDLALEILEQPRFFEWNLLHRVEIKYYCVDIDGVLCLDPTDSENDDGPNYIEFLKNAKPLITPTYPIGTLVTNRLEKYRNETVFWLDKHGILYDKLIMLNLNSKEDRIKSNPYGHFKAQIYKNLTDSILFIESSDKQAEIISKESGKYCYSFESNKLFDPNFTNKITIRLSRDTNRIIKKIRRKLKVLLRKN